MSAAPHASPQAEAGTNRLSALTPRKVGVPRTSVCGQAEADIIIPKAKRNPDNSRSASETERQGAKALAKWDNSPFSAKPPRSGTIHEFAEE